MAKQKQLRVLEPAIKYPKGRISKGTKAMEHDDIVKKNGGKDGKRGFILSDGTFAGRKTAAKVSKAAHQVAHPGKKLHSHELRAGKKDT